jgi:hypothetical protein
MCGRGLVVRVSHHELQVQKINENIELRQRHKCDETSSTFSIIVTDILTFSKVRDKPLTLGRRQISKSYDH